MHGRILWIPWAALGGRRGGRSLVGRTPSGALLRSLLQGQPTGSVDEFYRLRSSGIVVGDSARDMKLRCQLYETYLARYML